MPDDVLGVAVIEWVPGQSLAETLATGPLRTPAVLAMVDPLARAAAAAHWRGLVLGCGQPQRIRISTDGAARLAFALPHTETTPAHDVRGLGATLYALLTGTWPLSDTDAELAGLPPAARDRRGGPLPLEALWPGVGLEVSALALGALGTGASYGRIHTAAAVHQVLSELLATEQELAVLPPPDDGAPLGVDEVWQPESALGPQPDPRRGRKLWVGMGGLGLAVIVVLAHLGLQFASLLGLTPPTPTPIVVTTPDLSPPTMPDQLSTTPRMAPPPRARSRRRCRWPRCRCMTPAVTPTTRAGPDRSSLPGRARAGVPTPTASRSRRSNPAWASWSPSPHPCGAPT